jgi:hypothetical protein
MQRLVLILTYQTGEQVREEIGRVANMLDCTTPFEVTSFWDWRQRWGAYDWDSPAFGRAILKRYRKICVYGSVGKEDREMLERLRPLFEKGITTPTGEGGGVG